MVAYTILTVTLELDATQAGRARKAVKDAFLDPQETSDYAQMAEALPMLHFMSMVLFEDDHHDTLLTLEVNFDGPAGPFFRRLEQEYASALREIIRCSKRPRNAQAALYDRVTAAGSTEPLAPYLEACAIIPVTPYRGARGFSRDRILQEAKLYRAVQERLGSGERYAGKSASDAHADLRADPDIKALLSGAAPEELPWRPPVRDWVELVLVVVALLVALGSPGLVAAWFFNPLIVLAVLAAALAGAAFGWTALRSALAPAAGADAGLPIAILIGVTAGVALLLVLSHRIGAIGAPAGGVDWGGGFWALFAAFAALVLAGLLAALLVLLGLLALLRRLERSDPVHDPAVLSQKAQQAIAEMADREDRISQNHMGSLLIVKPGLLRTVLLRVGHLLLSRLARTVFADGFLGPMRTIHFAHWCILDNGARLVFFSNFDGSWDSYLSDFTEKASAGVNLAWANCIGFPEAAFIISGGSENGRQFKAWARHSMAPTLFWFSAYREVSVNEIHRNARVAAGLRKTAPADPVDWAKDL